MKQRSQLKNQTRFKRSFLCLIFVLTTLFFIEREVTAKDSLELNHRTISMYKLWQSMRAEHYLAPSAAPIEASQKLFLQLFQYGLNKELQSSLNQIGFKAYFYNSKQDAFIIVQEIKKPYTGAGFYVIRRSKEKSIKEEPAKNKIMLQAPHGYKDLNTAKLAIKLMLDGRFTALAINTVPRSYPVNGEMKNADMAHSDNTFFVSFSHAFARFYFDSRIIQLHGFNQAARPTTQTTDMIVSAGTRQVDYNVKQQTQCLNDNVSRNTKSFPDEIGVLGGTTNRIGVHLRNMGYSGFMHYEMSLPLRRKLINNKKSRQQLSTCMESAMRSLDRT